MGHYRLAEVSTVSYSPPLSGHYRSYEHVQNTPWQPEYQNWCSIRL